MDVYIGELCAGSLGSCTLDPGALVLLVATNVSTRVTLVKERGQTYKGATRGRARRWKEVLSVIETSRAGQVGGDGNGETGAPDLRQDVRPEKLGIEKHSPPARCPFGWEARPRLPSRRAQLAAPRG